MRETPETDDAQFGTGRVSVDFARRLERERDEARELVRELRDALDQCREDSIQLKAEWEWKRKNAGPRNERDYFEVECHIQMADGALTKAKEVLGEA